MKWISLQIRLKFREKVMLVFLAFTLVMSLALQRVFFPRFRALQDVQRSIHDKEEEFVRFVADQPSIEERKSSLRKLKSEYRRSKRRLAKMEETLMDRSRIPDLLKQIMGELKKRKVDMRTLKPVELVEGDVPAKGTLGPEPGKEGEGAAKPFEPYEKFFLEMTGYASFDHLIEFIESLETMPGYLRVKDVKIFLGGERKDKPGFVVTARTLLGVGAGAGPDEEMLKDLPPLEAFEKIPDPFYREAKPLRQEEPAGLKLKGILWNEKKPRALINNQVVEIGDLVDDKKVTSITKDTVILQQEDTEFLLTVKSSSPKAGGQL